MVINKKTSLITLFIWAVTAVAAQTVEIVVHRGANALAPENTWASAEAALQYGAKWIELDVRKSKDGVLFNLHDATLNRTTNGKGKLSEMLSADVRKLDAGSWFGPQYAGLKVPTIAEMLDSLKGKANVFFDVKRGTPIPTLVNLVREKGFADNSFFWFGDETMLREFITLAPEMRVKVNAGDIDRLRYWQKICTPSYVEVAPEKITEQFRSYCHHHGIKVMAACQEDDISQFQLVIDRKADMVNLDRPEAFIPLLKQYNYVDPRIGSEGVGRTFPGPSMPFGMCKPGPDCTVIPNAGWAPMPQVVTGFSQTHVSGTGGGQKYGNILIQPGVDPQYRIHEDIALGYYSTEFENHIRTEITTSERCAFYRIHYPEEKGSLLIDATHFLGKDPVPNLRERQQFVGASVEVVNDFEVKGYTCIRGGWNNGDAYTVYFYLQADKPFRQQEKDDARITTCFQSSNVNIKVGISYVSTEQAKQNIPDCDFDTQLGKLCDSWEQLLSRVKINGTEKDKRMFYTALYHTMLMPVDKTGENPKWSDTPYYDDYYAIWDTYRTSSPLITLLDEQREVAIVNSLLNIYKGEGYMPDARSGDCNGRTQGGSNAEVVVADAFVKGVKGIDYNLALEAMLKDAEVDPGAEHEKHGRGGLTEYNKLGYIPYGIDRAGNRTIEYSYNDFCIAEVAKGLGRTDIYERFLRQSGNWKNLWRSDYEWDGVKGYILPKDAEGRWLDSVPWGHSKVFHPLIPYTPITKVAPWYLPWWSTFFYEALSAEYSLSIPHDVPGLIAACGGEEAFRRRLDLFFERKRYNVGNEPSFLTPCLYHWIDRPDLTSDRVRQIITENYTDKPDGLPGNDDSGAMSSWFAFHLLGLYPNAGQSYYLLHAPLIPEWSFRLSNGKTLHGVIDGEGTHFDKVTFNGKILGNARIEHADLIKGGELVFYMSDSKSDIGNGYLPDEKKPSSGLKNISFQVGKQSKPMPFLSTNIAFTLNKQFRTPSLTFAWQGDTLVITCKETTYMTPRSIVEKSKNFCWDIPADGAVYQTAGTFAFISRKAMKDLKKDGSFIYDDITWRLVDQSDVSLHVQADIDGTEMWIMNDDQLPLVLEMRNNPLGIDWIIEY